MREVTPTTTDEELMSLYLQANSAAFDELYRRYAGKLFAYFKKKVPAPIAEELLQDVFTRMHSSNQTYKMDYPFLPWIFTIARHTFLDHLKKAESQLLRAVVDHKLEGLSDELPIFGVDIDTKALLAPLSPQQKKVFELRYLKDWSFEQISQETGLNTTNIRKIISRGLKKMKSTGQEL